MNASRQLARQRNSDPVSESQCETSRSEVPATCWELDSPAMSWLSDMTSMSRWSEVID